MNKIKLIIIIFILLLVGTASSYIIFTRFNKILPKSNVEESSLNEELVYYDGTLEKIEGDILTLSYIDESTSATSSATLS